MIICNSGATTTQDESRGPEASAAAPEPRRPGRGRPRDPMIETRVHAAALELYSRQGWQGFNLDAVAHAASVGKEALYRRWKTREILLEEVIRGRWEWFESMDQGSLRGDMLLLAKALFGVLTGPHGEVFLQMQSDARHFDEVRAFATPYRAQMVQHGRQIVRRAITRGELPPDINPALVIDLLVGGIINHVVFTPPHLRGTMIDQGDRFVVDAVDVIVAGVTARTQPTEGRG